MWERGQKKEKQKASLKRGGVKDLFFGDIKGGFQRYIGNEPIEVFGADSYATVRIFNAHSIIIVASVKFQKRGMYGEAFVKTHNRTDIKIVIKPLVLKRKILKNTRYGRRV